MWCLCVCFRESQLSADAPEFKPEADKEKEVKAEDGKEVGELVCWSNKQFCYIAEVAVRFARKMTHAD